MVNVGKKAPDITLPGVDESGAERVFSLGDFSGECVVLYFYPKDNTPGCTQEACDFRDSMMRVKAAGAQVIGVSPDSVESHRRFMEKHGLRFTLLSDPDKKAAAAYGAYGEKKMYGKTSMGIIRSTFLIDGDGVVRHTWSKVKVKGHVDEVLEALAGLK